MTSKTEQTSRIVNLIDAVTEAAEVGLTRGEVQALLVGGRCDQGAGVIAAILRPGTFPDALSDDDHRRFGNVRHVAMMADVETIAALIL